MMKDQGTPGQRRRETEQPQDREFEGKSKTREKRFIIAFRVSILRLLFLELTRVFNGLLACACMIFDLGCMSPLL